MKNILPPNRMHPALRDSLREPLVFDERYFALNKTHEQPSDDCRNQTLKAIALNSDYGSCNRLRAAKQITDLSLKNKVFKRISYDCKTMDYFRWKAVTHITDDEKQKMLFKALANDSTINSHTRSLAARELDKLEPKPQMLVVCASDDLHQSKT